MVDSVLENSLVSIVLPTYKRAHVLPHAIQSVLNQTYTNLELIVVDDNSPDATREVVASFDDSRIRYVRNEPNLKLPRALNRGFSLASGEYLTWTSDDNLYGETAIQRMVEVLQGGGCDFIYADYYLFADLDTTGRPLDVHHDKLPGKVQLDKCNHIGACFMYTREVYEAVGEYDPELFLVEDYDYFMRIAQRFRLCHIPEPLYYFRRDDDTLYISRFCEVKASDVLVRYKNGLLSEADVVEAIVTLLMRNPAALKNPILRWSDQAVRKLSFRLTTLHRKMLTECLRRRLKRRVEMLLEDYRAQRIAFAAAKDTLCGLMKELGTIAYTQPKTK
ncbi:MAG: glycosyltransferase [Candidatus Nitrotoga sp.]|nr:glycosyltransferase [Candidatus Nitrotoga sp.]